LMAVDGAIYATCEHARTSVSQLLCFTVNVPVTLLTAGKARDYYNLFIVGIALNSARFAIRARRGFRIPALPRTPIFGSGPGAGLLRLAASRGFSNCPSFYSGWSCPRPMPHCSVFKIALGAMWLDSGRRCGGFVRLARTGLPCVEGMRTTD